MSKQLLKEVPNNVPENNQNNTYKGEFNSNVDTVEVDGKSITMVEFLEMKKDNSIQLKEVDSGKYKTLKKLHG